MNAISAARRELAELLAGAVAPAVAVVDHVPEELPTPCLVLDYPDQPLELGDDYSRQEWWLTATVYALVDLAANQQATEDLEDLLAGVLPALAASTWELGPITRPGPFRTTEWLAHGVAITVRNLITLNPGEST